MERVFSSVRATAYSRSVQTSRLWHVASVFIISVACAGLSGCGNGLAQVSGQVTLDGQPVHGGKGDTRVTVQLQPADGVGATAVGLADENGSYKIATGSQAGIKPGEYYVSCSVSTLGVAGPVADPKFANTKTSGLKLSVQPGKNEYNIPLQSPAKKSPRAGAK